MFHAALLYATSGMILSGDDLTKISAERRAVLTRIADQKPVQFQFENDQFEHGVAVSKNLQQWVLLNWTDQPVVRTIQIAEDGALFDVLAGRELEKVTKGTKSVTLLPRSGRVFSQKLRGKTK